LIDPFFRGQLLSKIAILGEKKLSLVIGAAATIKKSQVGLLGPYSRTQELIGLIEIDKIAKK